MNGGVNIMTVKSCEKIEKSRVVLTIEVSAAEFEAAMTGVLYQPEAILEQMQTLDFSAYFAGIAPEEFVKALF